MCTKLFSVLLGCMEASNVDILDGWRLTSKLFERLISLNGKKIVGKNNKVLVKGAAYSFSKTNLTARNQLPLKVNQFFFSI